MDRELCFISALLRAGPAEQAKFYARQLPEGVFVLRTAEIGWVNNTRASSGKYPSAQAFEHRFRCSLPRVKDTIAVTIQPVLDLAMFQQMNRLQEKVGKMLDLNQPVGDAMRELKAGAATLSFFTTDYTDSRFVASQTALTAYVDRIRQDQVLAPLRTPWPTLDRMVKYFSPGNVIQLVARLGVGKTWTVAYWANHYCSIGVPTLFITKEMPNEEIEERVEAIRFGLDFDQMRDGSLPPKELRRWRAERKVFKDFAKYPLVVSGDETLEGTGFSQVVAKIEQHRPRVVIIDGAYLMNAEGLSKSASKVERIAGISAMAKRVAKLTGVLLILVNQMGRKAEGKSNTKGTIADIYFGDTWAQDADYVFEVSGKRGSNARMIAILKGRNSVTGEFLTKFQISPKPDFSELSYGASVPGVSPGEVQFKGIT